MAQLTDNWTNKRLSFSLAMCCCWLKPSLDCRSFSLLGIWLSSELFCFNRLWSRTLWLQRSASILWACFTASRSEFNWSIDPPVGEEEMSEGEEEKREFFLTCCWPIWSWSCSCCCSLSFWSIRRSISLTFSLNWQDSSCCLLTLCFKCLTSPSSAATWARRMRKRGKGREWSNFMKAYKAHTDRQKRQWGGGSSLKVRESGLSQRASQFSLRTSWENVVMADMDE